MILRVPEIIRNDPYYLAIVEATEEMLDELKSNVVEPSDYISTATKSELLIIAQSQGIDETFKVLPCEIYDSEVLYSRVNSRGRQLLNEFPELIRRKGSPESVIRMTQIYLGILTCEVTVNADESYDLTGAVYEELSLADSELRVSLYDRALSYVSPVGRYFRWLIVTLHESVDLAVDQDIATDSVLIRYKALHGQRIEDLTQLVSAYDTFQMYPDSRDDSSLMYIHV